MHRLHCARCGATWPSESASTAVSCPVCALEANPQAYGSPSPAEDLSVDPDPPRPS